MDATPKSPVRKVDSFADTIPPLLDLVRSVPKGDRSQEIVQMEQELKVLQEEMVELERQRLETHNEHVRDQEALRQVS